MPEIQYFTNIDGKYVKDAEARQQLNDLEDYVESLDQPWTPLQDGYSNFWFELTEDTLSPWLNFSAKTESAVIDWGDGSGEVALDTLTPTHTYFKAGRYVVKVKGVTGIAAQHTAPLTKYIQVLRYVELNDDVTQMSSNVFRYCTNLKEIVIPNTINIPESAFAYVSALEEIPIINGTIIPITTYAYCFSVSTAIIPEGITTIRQSAFYFDISLRYVSMPSTLTYIWNYAFQGCMSLGEIHCLATTPPTLGNNVFASLPSDFIIYVPVGYGDTYKAASGWSTYADHILEEGQTPNRLMLAKFNTDEPQDDMR